MSLSPQEFQAAGLTPPPPQSSGPSFSDQWNNASAPTPSLASQTNTLEGFKSSAGGQAILHPIQTSKNVGSFLTGSEQATAKDVGATQTTFTPESQKVMSDSANQLIQHANTLSQGDPRRNQLLGIAKNITDTASGQAQEQSDNIPSTGKTLLDVGGVTADILGAGTYKGSGAMESGVLSKATPDIIKGAQAVGDKLASVGEDVAQKSAQKTDAKSLQTAIDAVNPDLKGNKLAKSLSKSFGRDATEAGVMTAQKQGASSEATRLGTSLRDVLTSKDPLTNLKSLGTAMTDTESRLKPLLLQDKTPFIKQSVTNGLDELKNSGPREFRIGEPGKVFNDVVDFAKETIQKSEPNMNGLRNAVTDFDNQAMKQYPNAYKSGAIDTKSAAGSAIKNARDFIRDYMYNTAEKGSELQSLIGRERDIFRAADAIGPKAAENSGKNLATRSLQAIKAHPVYAAAAPLAGFEGVRKAVTGSF